MLLDRVEKVETDPFPHVVIENALESSLYNGLYKTRPSPQEILRGRPYRENQRIDLPTEIAITALHPLWREFCFYHASNDFFEKAKKVFGFPQEKAALRCQPGVNTPTGSASRVRGPHLDNPRELYAGLFYMPSDEDGGDLEIYRWKEYPRFYGKLEVEDECVELVRTVKYRPNTFVMFLNTKDSLHGVTPRKSDNFRFLVNVIADVPEPQFFVGHGRY